jgi:hypothetical protein
MRETPLYPSVMSQSDSTADDAPTTTIPVNASNDDDRGPGEELAAALPDDAPVRRIDVLYDLSHVQKVTAWINDDVDEVAAIYAPGAWTIGSVVATTPGGRGVRMTREPPEVED